jgi:hypothetical protein
MYLDISEIIPIIIIFGIYLLGVHFARCLWIVIPTRELLRAQIESVSFRIKTELDTPINAEDKVIIGKIFSVLGEAKKRSNRVENKEHSLWKWIKCKIKCFICEDYLPGWRLVHEAERLQVDLLRLEQVKVRLGTASDELKEMKAPYIKKLAETIDHALKEDKEENKRYLQALLKESLRIIYDDRDSAYGTLATFHNKALWLIGATIGIIILLALTVGDEVLFLAGGVGGLLSLLRRITKVPRLPTDYGAYWTTFFYSPLIGALSGWTGVFLLALLIDANIIGSFFKISWDGLNVSLNPEVIGFAVLFGYSMAVFERLTEKLESATGASVQH